SKLIHLSDCLYIDNVFKGHCRLNELKIKLMMSNIKKENSDFDIFNRLKAGEPIQMDDPEYTKILEEVNRTIRLSSQIIASTDLNEVRKYLGKIVGTNIDESTTVFP